MRIVVESVGQLRVLAIDGTARGLRVEVTGWHPPRSGWSGRLGPLPGLVELSVRLPVRRPGPATVEVALAQPVAVRMLLLAVVAVLVPVRSLPADVATSSDDAILVDAMVANPRGRQLYGYDLPDGLLRMLHDGSGYRWQIAAAGTVVVAGQVGAPLDDAQLAALAQLGVVTVSDALVEIPVDAMAVVAAQLAMTGVVVRTTEPAFELLAPELAAVVEAALPAADADPLEWELRSVVQRRAAMRGHASGLATYLSTARPPSVSALLVTRRPTHVVQAVAAMTAQSYPELEIVVGLHGFDLPTAERGRLSAAGRPVHVLTLRAELTFGEALAEATRAAGGSLVTKVDDDDRYGREHVWDLVIARHYSAATVVGKAAEFVYLAPYDVTVRRRMGSEFYSDVVAGGAMLLSRGDLEEVGGWQPLRRSVDRALLDRVLGAGGLVYRTHALGFVYTRHTDGHTWDPGIRYFLRDPIRHWPGLPSHDELG